MSDNSSRAALDELGDFTTTTRVLPISALAVGIGVAGAFVAAALLKLIGLFTNLFFFQRVRHDARRRRPAIISGRG